MNLQSVKIEEEILRELGAYKITDHKFKNPCWCGCDGSEMRCCHYNEDCEECLKTKEEHEE